jgi:hypothetical protein
MKALNCRKDLLFVADKTVSFALQFEANISLLDKVTSIKASFEPFNMSE